METERVSAPAAVRYSAEHGVARIRLAAPDSGNALNRALLSGLLEALREAESTAGIRVVVLEAEGAEFCRGLDLNEVLSTAGALDLEPARLFLRALSQIRGSARPVLARVEGPVTGGGLGLVAACDLVLARREAVFMLPEALLGLLPALITPFLLRRITPARLQFLALSTRSFRAVSALSFGLIDEVVEGSMEDAERVHLKRLRRSAPDALAECKRYIDAMNGEDLNRQCDAALERFSSWMRRPEVRDGLRRFAEGHCPPWFEGGCA